MKTELVTTLKRQAARVLSDLHDSGEPVLITEHGKPSAYLVDVNSFEFMQHRMSILEGSADGSPVYEETHTVTTSPVGLANLVIGDGSVVSGVFEEIARYLALKFWLKNEMVSPVHSLPKTHKLNLMIWTAVNSVCPYRSTEVRVPIPLPVVKQHIFAGLDLN